MAVPRFRHDVGAGAWYLGDMSTLPTKQDILDWISENPTLTAKRDIAKAFGIKGAARIDLKRLLKELEADGELGSTIAGHVKTRLGELRGEIQTIREQGLQRNVEAKVADVKSLAAKLAEKTFGADSPTCRGRRCPDVYQV